MPIKNPSKPLIEQITSSTGIIICGGETEKYQEYIVETEIGQSIQKMYLSGIPVAGFSAGALISPAHCVIPPIDNSRQLHLYLKGLSLIKDCVISVHYSTWDEKENLKAAIKKTNVTTGYGLDDQTGVYFINENLSKTEGGKLYVVN
ncbi:Type 1 glutamine amidotransferase-like domain-containing protein [Pseudogracilibacillus auburnensis]|uniref:Type 1 glutamine amidotransferase-like domain-containing protein n=1 Tax=Pseudogracilibacillus auburnensis TaxID=1494959 RepID=UPI0027DA0B2C|nr:Type 1 glutamine amidotransferase-like domain-containing protein [Pseudogracilibacillus auburnensis]